MVGDFKDALSVLTSRSDWAIVGGAALVGYTLDLAIDIVALPGASPGVCGGIAAGGALVAKRSYETWRDNRKDKQLLVLCQDEAMALVIELEAANHAAAARQLDFEARLAGTEGNVASLREAIAKARALL